MSKYRTTSMSIDIGAEWPTLIDIRVIGPVLARYRPDSLVLLGQFHMGSEPSATKIIRIFEVLN